MSLQFTTVSYVRNCPDCGTPLGPRRRLCDDCRARHRRESARPMPPRDCEICGRDYKPTYGQQRTCGRKCGETMRRTITGTLPADRTIRRGVAHRRADELLVCKISYVTCDQCGKLFTARYGRKRCGDECAYKANIAGIKASIKARYATDPAFRDEVLARAHARRAQNLGLGNAKITLTYLIKRDHGRCGICHEPVRAKRGPRRPSQDHIVPLAAGGTHELANLQLAHYVCNLRKNARGGGEQLLLIG